MRRRRSELKAGIFILFCFILFWVVLVSISDLRTLFGPRRTYVLAFNQVGGLERNSIVRYAGYQVGRVVDISFAEPPRPDGQSAPRRRVPEPVSSDKPALPCCPENIFVTVQVRSDVQLTSLDQAEINATFTGSIALDILPGTPGPGETPVAINEDYILLGQPYLTVGQLVHRAAEVVDGARDVMPAVKEAVGSLTDTMKDARSTVQRVNQALDDNRPRIDQTFKDMAEASQNIKGITAEIKPKLPETLEKIRQAAGDAAETLAAVKPRLIAAAENAQQATSDLRKTSSTALGIVAQNHHRADQILENLRNASARLNIGIEDIRRNPWKLLDRNINADPRTQNIYDSALAFSEAARALSQAAADLKALAESEHADPEVVKKASEELDKLVGNLSSIEKQLYLIYKAPPGP